MAFATLTQFKTHLNFPASDTSKDTELQLHLDAANNRVENLVGQSTAASHTERLYSVSERLRTGYRPINSITSITAVEGSTGVSTTDVVIEQTDGIIRRLSGRCFSGWYDVVYNAGYSSVLAQHTLATMIIGQHLWMLQNGRGRAASGPEDVAFGAGFAIPNRALELLYDSTAMTTGFG